ncbi:hypothetical protein E4U41_002428 [Claviceps citrina]|nr:hypothetical protein E4U41_002428 [Claviceps citrina]
MSLSSAVKDAAASSSLVPGPATDADLPRSLEEARARATEHSNSILRALDQHSLETARIKQERRQIRCKIYILSRDIRVLFQKLASAVSDEDSALEASISEKQSRRRELKRQRDACVQKAESVEDAVHLLGMRKERVENQIKLLKKHMSDIEKANKVLAEKDEYIRQTRAETTSAQQLLEEKRKYICRAELETQAAQNAVQVKHELIRRTESGLKEANDFLEQKSKFIRQSEMSTKLAQQVIEQKQEYIRQSETDVAQAHRAREKKREQLDDISRAAKAQLQIVNQQLTKWKMLPGAGGVWL